MKRSHITCPIVCLIVAILAVPLIAYSDGTPTSKDGLLLPPSPSKLLLTIGKIGFPQQRDLDHTIRLSNLGSAEDNPPVTTALSSIMDRLVIVYGFEDGEWNWYNPDWPPDLNTLATLYISRGYWVNMTEDCSLTYGANNYQLDEGWNVIGWRGYQECADDNQDVATGLASIIDKLEVACGFNNGELTWYSPFYPVEMNTLTTLCVGSGYWITVSEDCILTYGDSTFQLDEGRNLIGWVGSSDTPTVRDYRQDMRNFVQSISAYAKETNPDFIIIPQNGHTLLTEDGESNGLLSQAFLRAIDGVGRENLFYGYNGDDMRTPVSVQRRMISFMDIAETNGIEVLVIDYCSTCSFVDNSYRQNAIRGYVSFAADHRELDNIPAYPPNPYNVNDSNVTSLAEAKNFLYLINPGLFPNRRAFLNAIRKTDYDIIFVDLFYDDLTLTASEVASLKIKANGGSRLVIAYMSIGEAEDYRYYWQREWETTPPSWLTEENPQWLGNYKVRYWDAAWQDIIYGNRNSYLGKVLDAGFDGVYLDIIDAFEYYEDR